MGTKLKIEVWLTTSPIEMLSLDIENWMVIMSFL